MFSKYKYQLMISMGLLLHLMMLAKLVECQYRTTPSLPESLDDYLPINNNLLVNSSKSQEPSYASTGRKISQILDNFFSMGYDKRIRPNYGGPPVEVNVTMHIISISSVSEILMDFTADFYFRQTWIDPRLRFKQTAQIRTLYVGSEVSAKIWLPDTFFGNEKTAYFHTATTPNVFLRIDHTGEVYRSIRLTVTSSCAMRLQYFPMDRQQCTIEVESYGYSVRDIIYYWKDERAVVRDKTISLPQFDVIKTEQKTRTERLTTGNYSRLVAEIHFSRRMGYYLIQIYIPSSLIVVISWVSFWLHRNASPARVQLGVTTVLTMTTLMSSTNAALPKISYVKSIDIFLGTSFIMVFAALLEYATVGYLGKRIAMRRAKSSALLSQSLPILHKNNNQNKPNQYPNPSQTTYARNDATTQQLAATLIHLQNSQKQNDAELLNLGQDGHDQTGLYDQNSHTAGQVSPSALISQQYQPHQQLAASSSRELHNKNYQSDTLCRQPSTSLLHRNNYAASATYLPNNLPYLQQRLGLNLKMSHIFGIRPSDVDKYSRVVFPVCFICFQLMYWIVYLHISAFLEDEQAR